MEPLSIEKFSLKKKEDKSRAVCNKVAQTVCTEKSVNECYQETIVITLFMLVVLVHHLLQECRCPMPVNENRKMGKNQGKERAEKYQKFSIILACQEISFCTEMISVVGCFNL